MTRTHINEIFSSIQGEGLYMGERQIFVRFAECNLRCSYCDTNFSPKFNLSVAQLLKKIGALDKKFGPHKSVSLTGGEPLLHLPFLSALSPHLKRKGFSIYLETNGTLPDALKKIIGVVDIIAMDMKLPSATNEKEFWAEHKEFLNIARKKNIFAKIVATLKTDSADFKKAVAIIKGEGTRIPLVLQPNYDEMGKRLMGKIADFQRYALRCLSDVRIIPQVHKIIGAR